MDVKDYVPYLRSWRENIATLLLQGLRAVKCLPRNHLPRCAKTMLDSKDFSRGSCLELLKSIAFAANRNNQSGLSADSGSPNAGERTVTLGAFVHGGMKGITKRTFQQHNLTKYLIAL